MKDQCSPLTDSTQAVGVGRSDSRPRDLLAASSPGVKRRVLWIDGIGGFLLIDRTEVVIGQATSGSAVDVGIVGDLSRQACAIRRVDGDYLVQPLQAMRLDGRLIDRPQLLNHSSQIQLGQRVKLQFTQPNPLSATARLELLSLNRFKPHVDGVLLLADSCILGPSGNSHVVCPDWKSELLMYRHGEDWFFRSLEPVDVNGQITQGQIPLQAGMRLRGEEFSLSIE